MSELKKLPRIIRHCMTIGMLPTSYKVSLTYEEQLMWFCKFLEDEVIPVVNNNSQVVEELKNYFETLDVQEEINNKLDEMAESGELLNIIIEYLNTGTILVFNTVSDMLSFESFEVGSTAQTLGFYELFDGGGATYKVIDKPEVLGDNMIEINENLAAQIIIEDGKVNVRQFGAKGDGITDDTSIIQKSIDFAIANDYNVFFPNGTYKTSHPIGVSTSLATSQTLPTIYGEKQTGIDYNLTDSELSGAIILYSGTAENAVQIINTNRSNYFTGGTIKDISIINTQDKASDGSKGLYMEGCIDYRLYNVSCIGFNYGFYNKYGWSFDTFGLICVRNKIGVFLDNNSNACGLHGSQLHQNDINIKIISGTNIDIDKATLEGGGAAVVITSDENVSLAPSNINIKNCYLEANTKGFIIGKDEENNVADKSIEMLNISNISISSNNLDYVFEFDNAKHIKIENINYGQAKPLYSSTANTQYISFDNLGNKFYLAMQNRNMVENKTGVKNGHNLVVNGFLAYPFLRNLKNAGFTVEFDTSTFAGEKVIKITIPNGTSLNVSNSWKIKLNNTITGKKLLIGVCGMKTSADMTANLINYNRAGTGLGNNISLTTEMKEQSNYILAPDSDYLNIALGVANNTGSTQYVYIKYLIVTDNATDTIVATNPLDTIAGYSGVLSVSETPATVTMAGFTSDMYNVFVTSYTSGLTPYVTKNDDSFSITANASGTVSYFVIPTCRNCFIKIKRGYLIAPQYYTASVKQKVPQGTIGKMTTNFKIVKKVK